MATAVESAQDTAYSSRVARQKALKAGATFYGIRTGTLPILHFGNNIVQGYTLG